MFGSAHVKIGVWPKVGLQAFFTAGQAWRTPQPLQIKSGELNWVKRRTSHEPNCLNWVRLMWSTAFDPGLSYVLQRFLLLLVVFVVSYAIEQFSFEYPRKTKTKVVTLANHKAHRQSREPIKTRSKRMLLKQSEGKRVPPNKDWLWFHLWLDEKVPRVF